MSAFMHAVALVLNTWIGILEGTDKTTTFLKIKPNPSGPLRLSSGLEERLPSSCAASCLARFPNCHGFMYNDDTKLCTPSSGLSAEQPRPSLEEGDLYLVDSSQSYLDFSIKSNGSTKVNVAYYSNTPLNYTDASAACESVNSHLYVPDTLEKYWLIFAIINISDLVYVGLDDMAVEGHFVWADSGQEIDSNLKKAIFLPGQPDNWNNTQDCAVVTPDYPTLDDIDCSTTAAYICEKPLP